MPQDTTKYQSAVFALSIFVGALFLAYCTVYLCACPSLPLASAVFAELLGFVISIMMIKANVFVIPEKWLKRVPQCAVDFCRNLRDCFDKLKLLLLSVLSVVAAVDFMALCLSFLG